MGALSDIFGAVKDPQFRADVGDGLVGAVNRGAVGQTFGAPMDIANVLTNLAKAAYGTAGRATGLLSADQMPELEDKPVMGSEWLGQKMQDMGFVSDKRNALAEGLAGGALAPLGGAALAARAPQIAAAALQAQANLAAPARLNKEAGVWMFNPPSQPNPLVGTRFERDFVGDMAPKTQRRIEDLQGSSLLAMPWDSTSRGYSVKSISDELLPHPVLTTGGQDFARDLSHTSTNVGGASGEDIARRIQDRVRLAAKENEHFGGNGSVYSLPTTMGAGGENFSTMPTEALLGLLQKQDLAPS